MRNVLEGLEIELRDFLVDTCVLTTLSGQLCDDLLERAGSARLLRELEAAQLFTYELDDGSYRYHETLRSQLEATLVERLGESDTRPVPSCRRAARSRGCCRTRSRVLPCGGLGRSRAPARTRRAPDRRWSTAVARRHPAGDPAHGRVAAADGGAPAARGRSLRRGDRDVPRGRGLLQRVGCDRSLPPRADRTRDLGRAAPAARPRRARSAPHRDDARAAIRPSSGNTARDAGGPRRERARGAPRGALPRRSCSARTRADEPEQTGVRRCRSARPRNRAPARRR